MSDALRNGFHGLTNNRLFAGLVLAIVLGSGGYVWNRLQAISSLEKDYIDYKATTRAELRNVMEKIEDVRRAQDQHNRKLDEIERLLRKQQN